MNHLLPSLILMNSWTSESLSPPDYREVSWSRAFCLACLAPMFQSIYHFISGIALSRTICASHSHACCVRLTNCQFCKCQTHALPYFLATCLLPLPLPFDWEANCCAFLRTFCLISFLSPSPFLFVCLLYECLKRLKLKLLLGLISCNVSIMRCLAKAYHSPPLPFSVAIGFIDAITSHIWVLRTKVKALSPSKYLSECKKKWPSSSSLVETKSWTFAANYLCESFFLVWLLNT